MLASSISALLRRERLTEEVRERLGVSHDEYLDRNTIADFWKYADSEDEFVHELIEWILSGREELENSEDEED